MSNAVDDGQFKIILSKNKVGYYFLAGKITETVTHNPELEFEHGGIRFWRPNILKVVSRLDLSPSLN